MIWLLLGPWRWWVGRGSDVWPSFIGNGLARIIQYVTLIAVGTVCASNWLLGLTTAACIVGLTSPGHTPMLYGPNQVVPPARIKGIELILWNLANKFGDGELRWWMFGLLRYVMLSVILATVLIVQGARLGWLVIPGTVLLVASYRVAAALVPMRSPFRHVDGSEDHIQYAEMFGWAWLGLALAVCL